MHAFIIYSLLTCFITEMVSARVILEDYKKNRKQFLEEESEQAVGGSLQLNDEEIIVNDILMELKMKELNDGFHNPERFNLSKHYFTYRDHMEGSGVYQLIKRMPKGAALHIHSTFMLDADELLNLTYEDHLYACITSDDMQFQFSDNEPKRPCTTQWSLLSEIRNVSNDVRRLDLDIKRYFTLYTEDKNEINSDINTIWNRFNVVYRSVKSIIVYRPVREKFIYQSLKKFYDDNIMYVEIRSGLHSIHELNGTVHDKMYMAKMYADITRKFKEEHPDFIGIKLILTKNRKSNIEIIQATIEKARRLKSELPDLFAGLDLVGQEDLGNPLLDFLPALLEAKDDMNLYFHGGETNWLGTATDENLIDAVLLGSKRIGHAYALVKHPTLMNEVKKKDIAIEVNVISNAVLALVRDVRNHPLATYLAFGLPVVLSSDDPGVWGAAPLSHDFYVAFTAVASKRADLRLLKQLAINSIKYSALDNKEKAIAFEIFDKNWGQFVQDIITTNSMSTPTKVAEEVISQDFDSSTSVLELIE